MKSRRVIVTLEVDTTDTLSELRKKDIWRYVVAESRCLTAVVQQVQANVVKTPKAKVP